MAWAFGYVTLAVGHLNILSVSFTVTLIGIGIDYGVYYVGPLSAAARRAQAVRRSARCETARGVGPAIIAGALTTAIAFFAAGFTSFKGVAELGIIAGGGILLCCVARIGRCCRPRSTWSIAAAGACGCPSRWPVHTWIAPLMKLPRLHAGARRWCSRPSCRWGLTRLWYDNNLLNMQAVGLESVELERKLLAECNQSVWYALSIADSREELLARKAEFLKLGIGRADRGNRLAVAGRRRSQAADHRAHPPAAGARCPNGRR